MIVKSILVLLIASLFVTVQSSGAYILKTNYYLDGISKEQLQFIESVTLNNTNIYNLSYPNNCFNASADIASQISYTYGNVWSVYCSLEEAGDIYTNYFNESLVNFVVVSNNYKFQFIIWISDLLSSNTPSLRGLSSSKPLPKTQYNNQTQQKQSGYVDLSTNLVDNEEIFENPREISQEWNLQAGYGAAEINSTFNVGSGITQGMLSNIQTIVQSTATQYNLETNQTSFTCINCFKIAQAIDLNIQNYYGPYWTTSIIQYGYGDAYLPYINQRTLGMILFSNGWSYVVTIAQQAKF